METKTGIPQLEWHETEYGNYKAIAGKYEYLCYAIECPKLFDGYMSVWRGAIHKDYDFDSQKAECQEHYEKNYKAITDGTYNG